MNVLIETYIFYADIYLVQNIIIKTVVLYLTLRVQKLRFRIVPWKILMVSAIGTVFEMIGLMIIPNYNLFLVLVHLLEIPLMTWALVGRESNNLIKSMITGYFFTIVVNGVLEILHNVFGEMGHYYTLIVLSGGIVWAGVDIYLHKQKLSKGIFPLILVHQGKELSLTGYYDSGNRLKDPYTGRGVHIISQEQIEKLPIEQERKICIPYQSLGNTDGLIDVYYIDNMRVYGQSKVIEREKVPLAITEDSLFHGKKYQVIINEEIW